MRAAGAPMLVVAALLAASGQTSALTADIVFKNGNIHTVDPKQPRATAIAVAAGRIVFVGSDAAAENPASPLLLAHSAPVMSLQLLKQPRVGAEAV